MRRVAIAVGVGLVALALLFWRLRGKDETPAVESKPVAAGVKKGPRVTEPQSRVDAKKLERASIEGTVIDDKQRPLADARVCAAGSSFDLDPELFRDLRCTSTDQAGHYKLDGLYPATYSIGAFGKPYVPAMHHPGGDPRKTELRVAAGQHVTGADITLRPGGVEITGVVSDLTGGPIEKARVSSLGSRWNREAQVTTETAADGTFALWVAPGTTSVIARADGYADDWESAYAPGKVEIILTPESALAGTVVDAGSGEPIANARVSVSDSDWGSGAYAFSDEQGVFRVARLTPGRYTATARTDRGFGKSEGSTLVGLGQTVDGVVVKLHRAVRVEGKVLVSSTKQPCEEARVSMSDGPKGRWANVRSEPDGRVWADAVLPGKYSIDVQCEGFRSREKYDAVVVADKDVTDLVWEVDPGATVTGRVLAKSGAPVEGAGVSARSVGGEARKKTGWGNDRSLADGSYRLAGLSPGSYKLDVWTEKAVAPKDGYKVEVTEGTVTKDLVLEDTGVIKGMIVDGDGKPVAGVRANARPVAMGGRMFWRDENNKSDDAGTFTLEGLRPGDYRVVAQRSWVASLRKPGTTDDAEQGEAVTVRANQVATVKLVVESTTGVITGSVVDAAGAPVTDAFISAARESDAAGAQKTAATQTRWSWDEKPVLTSTDGKFTLTKLSPGAYTVRAYRKGGGEAVAEHVAIGGTATLQIKPTGSISGSVRTPAGQPEEMSISLRDLTTGFSRYESFFRTGGAFRINDLPKGKFQITASAEGAQAQLDLELGEGEQKTNIAIELAALVTLTGRVVEHGTTKPIAGIRMMARPAMGGGGFSFSMNGEERDFITDETGRFTLKNAPRGKIALRGMPKDFTESDYAPLSLVRDANGSGTAQASASIDLGDLPMFRNRVKPNEPAGKLGIRFKEPAPDEPPDKRSLVVSWIDPAGPAAKTELKVGDVITTADGVDVTGAAASNWGAITRAPPGTKLSLGLARGATIAVVLAPP